MAFTVRRTKHRAWPVSIKQPTCGDDGDVIETVVTFVAHFAAFTETDLEAAIADAEKRYPLPKKMTSPPLSLSLTRNAAVFRSLIVGWGAEVKDEAGASIPFSGDALADLVTGPDGLAVSTGINAALFQLRFGTAPAKNSPASPEPGAISAPAEAAQTSDS